jgi:hypothetical protein
MSTSGFILGIAALVDRQKKFVFLRGDKAMLTSRRGALALRKRSSPQIWVCMRCFHTQMTRLQEHPPSGLPKSKKPLSPIEQFRRQVAQQQDPPPDVRIPPSPAELFQFDWSKIPAEDQSARPLQGGPSLEDLAGAYRKSGTTRKYVKRDVWLPTSKPKESNEETLETLEKLEESRLSELSELSRLDELDELDAVDTVDIFGGEITRDYQGVLPLHGQGPSGERYPIKQGALVEFRKYI